MVKVQEDSTAAGKADRDTAVPVALPAAYLPGIILLEVASQVRGFEPFLGGMRLHYRGRSELNGVVVLLVGIFSFSLPMPCENCPQSCILSFLYSFMFFKFHSKLWHLPNTIPLPLWLNPLIFSEKVSSIFSYSFVFKNLHVFRLCPREIYIHDNTSF